MKRTKQINVGGVLIGGGAPITVQSMTTTKTEDAEATLRQIHELAAAGCDIVRLAVPNMDAAIAIGKIKEKSPLPIVADIHFNYKLALTAAEAGADKIRINPGNIGSPEHVKAVADACGQRNIPIRIGINSGSLEKEILAKHGNATPEAMIESASGHIELLNRFDFDDICLSFKSSEVMATVAANISAAERFDYPLHIGITATGLGNMALIKSSMGIGALLFCSVGDTIRVSLTGNPVEEVLAGINILKAAGHRKQGVEIISCPGCGRADINIEALYRDVEAGLQGYTHPVKVAVMGCEVNGPGEASAADYGVAGGVQYGIIFKKGQRICKVPADEMADALCRLVFEDGRNVR